MELILEPILESPGASWSFLGPPALLLLILLLIILLLLLPPAFSSSCFPPLRLPPPPGASCCLLELSGASWSLLRPLGASWGLGYSWELPGPPATISWWLWGVLGFRVLFGAAWSLLKFPEASWGSCGFLKHSVPDWALACCGRNQRDSTQTGCDGGAPMGPRNTRA